MVNKIRILRKLIKKFLASKITRGIGLGLAGLLVLASLVFFIFNLIFEDKILPHTYIGQNNFGGLNRAQAEEKLLSLKKNSLPGSLSFSWDNKNYSISSEELGLNYQDKNPESLDRLLAVGRSGGIRQVLKEQFRALFGHNQVFAAYSLDEEKLNDFLAKIAQDLDRPEKNASIVIKDLPDGEAGNNPAIVPEEIGQKFPLDENRQIAQKTIGSFNLKTKTAFIVRKLFPQVTAFGAELALAETKILLSRHLILKTSQKTFEIFPNDIAGFLKFETVFGRKGVLGITSEENIGPKEMTVLYSLSADLSQEKIKEFVQKIASEIDQEAKDAKFEVSGGRVQTFQVAQTGFEVDQEKAIALIIEGIVRGEQTIELPIKVTEPEITSASGEGIEELIGEGRTSWRGSPANRIHNLTLGANNISGTIVKPGQEFSTLKAIGHVGPQTGFLQELVIKNSTRVEPEYGGGLCQVSTTLFRAAIYSGLKITARTPHSFRVSYYEPPVGMDATVYDPAPDFRFINDYETPILIWAIAGNNSLVFQIYGKKDGRKIEISDPVTFDYVSAGEAIYTETPTMATGAIRQVERATSGCTASFNYRVTARDGSVLENETFVSKYVAIPNSYLYGPGTEGIPGQEQSPAPTESTPTSSPTPFKKGT